MVGNILFTVMAFCLATAICLTLNYALVKTVWDVVPQWARQVSFIGCVAAIFATVYLVVGAIWGL